MKISLKAIPRRRRKFLITRTAKFLAPTLMLLAAWGWFESGDAWMEAEQAQNALDQARNELSSTQSIAQAARSLPDMKVNVPEGSAGTRMADLVLWLLQHRASYQVDVAEITARDPATVQGNLQSVPGMAKEVSKTGGKFFRTRLTIKGAYRDYRLFQTFLEAFSTMPVAIRNLQIEKQVFTMNVDVYGGAA